jgi:hypothetical protein
MLSRAAAPLQTVVGSLRIDHEQLVRTNEFQKEPAHHVHLGLVLLHGLSLTRSLLGGEREADPARANRESARGRERRSLPSGPPIEVDHVREQRRLNIQLLQLR